ncbi:MAG: ABC transporter ATP-binding protein [Armatimonadota bacterium]|nr:ABC transporter ATP-binding protein [Armatimonadota bacterium]MDR7426685.1 ABC transporter ATP-binding protein [Armatimonadota bacterium]MDR7465075.1 ABC transporter ATP-binding protein [Armatimonadota bacterium]MDR7469236.1 ABC transporter ATP-binding protein [Armatimonadota bacterium]MDR7475053.1 ABC transporter ATP-binding protein [Armatimonadota bacterium]
MDGVEVRALRGVTMTIASGEFVAIMGPSGSGKSTCLHIMGCLDRPTAGTYRLEGVDVTTLPDAALARLRSRRLGFVFQSYNLLPRLPAVENVELPMIYAGVPDRRARALAALEAVGLRERARHLPTQLSGGEQQRVAFARALVMSPAIILADEPTGNLDSAAAREIMTLVQRLSREGMTIVLVTHDAEIASCARRLIQFRDGRVVRDTPVRGGGGRPAP